MEKSLNLKETEIIRFIIAAQEAVDEALKNGASNGPLQLQSWTKFQDIKVDLMSRLA